MTVLDLIADCERVQRENFDIQQSLLDDPPVLIRATPLPVPTMPLGWSRSPLTATAAPAVPTHDNGRVGSPVRASADAATGGSF